MTKDSTASRVLCANMGTLTFFCHRCSDVGKVGRWSNSRLVVVSFICFIVKWKMAIFERYCN